MHHGPGSLVRASVALVPNVMDKEDPRRSMPSASGLGLIVRCHGSWKASRGLPPLPQTEEAEYGDECHSAFAGTTLIKDLDSAQKQQTVLDAMKIRDRLYEAIIPTEGADMTFTEERFWLKDPDGLPAFSGQVDWAAWHESGKALVLDLKSLYGDTPPPESNWQILGQGVAFFQEMDRRGHKITELYAGIIQPRITHKPDLVRYTAEQLWGSVRTVQRYIYEATERPDTPRIPGNHCVFCPAAGMCVEAQSMSAMLLYESPMMAVDKLSPEQLATILPKINVIARICTQVRARAKQLAEATPGAIPGYEIKLIDSSLTIDDIQGCYEKLKHLVTKEEFRARLKMPVTSIRDLFIERYSKLHSTTIKAAAEEFEKLVAGHSSRGPQQKRLQKETK